MIPVELRLTNFMSYKFMDEPVNFSTIHTAVLCGPNGHGKSSLLDAITWALWGQARGVDRRGTGTDDLIHHREPHMQVEFTFDLEGQRYRVIRSRSRKGKTGVSKLEFQLIDGDGARPLTGETITATQEAINRTLRMDYDTFVNSAFIMQGRADTFMAKSANERKEILSEILGLSLYDELEELARERRKAQSERVRDADVRIAGIQQELEQLPLHKEELAAASAELATVQAQVKELEGTLALSREKKAVFEVKQSQLDELVARTQQAHRDIAALDEQLDSLAESTAKAQSLVDKEAAINAAYARLIELRDADETLTALAQRHSKLERRATEVKLAIATAKSALEAEVEQLLRRKGELERELAGKAQVETRLTQVGAALAEIEPVKRAVEELRTRWGKLRERRASLEASIKAGEAKLAEEEKRGSLLTGGDTCPLCSKPLDEAERRALHQDISWEIAELTRRIEAERAEHDRIAQELPRLEAEGKALGEKVKSESALQAEKGKLETELGAFASAAGAIGKLQARLTEIRLKLAQDAFAEYEHSELKRVSAEIEKLGYSQDEHGRVKEELKTLAQYEALKANLESAKHTIASTGATIAALSAQKDAKRKAIEDDELRAAELTRELASTSEVERAIASDEAALAEKKRAEAEASDRRTAAQVKIENCARLAEKRDALARERKEAAHSAELYDTLAFIFSKKGIQALIIENTIPEIEQQANELLHRLTNGQMSLRFVTQKDKRTGGVVETLDLIVTDGELGDRKYELFSGGEAFRINFAVRIALSKLLARRSGAHLETLVIDEGFGTQDEEGKEKLIEAITAVQHDFKKVLVITHLDDLKELFPARIEVVKKRGTGSVATVV